MKKLILASLVSALSVTAAHAAPKVYGKLFVGLDYISNKGVGANADVDTVTVSSNASRFGIKGEDELTPTLSAIYQVEWGIAASTVGTNDLTGRNRFLGLKSTELGALKFGAFDTALKEAQNKVDIFNDLMNENADMKLVLTGENRLNRMVGYESPEIEGVPIKITLNAILDQGFTSASSAPVGAGNNKNGDNGFSGLVAYDQKGLYLGLAYDQRVSSQFFGLNTATASYVTPTGGTLANPVTPNYVITTNSSNVRLPADTIRGVLQLDFAKMFAGPAFTLGALYQNSKPNTDLPTLDQQNAWLISGNFKLPASVGVDGLGMFLQYQQSQTELKGTTADDLERSQIGGGLSYAYSKNTALYGYVIQQKFDTGAGINAVSALAATATANAAPAVAGGYTYSRDNKTNIIGMALEHKF